jgi:hypothetical protein
MLMRSPSLERLYAQLNKHILLAQSYTEVNELMFIIKACRLKPQSFVLEKRDPKLILHRLWFDEFGNSLRIIKNKRIRVTYNDLTLDKDKVLCTDLYYGLSLNRIAKISRLVFVCAAKDEETYHNSFMVAFLGLDNYLRAYVCTDGEWSQVAPLCLGMKNLKLIARNTDVKYFREFVIKENSPLPCVSAREWIAFMPPNGDFLQLIQKEYDQSLSFLNTNKGTDTTNVQS